MKKFLSCVLVVSYVVMAGASASVSYAQESKTGEGAVVGGLLGAVAGGVIGNQSHKTAQGALIGGAVGALGGAMVGSQMKSQPASSPVPATAVAAPAVKPAARVTMKQIIYWTEQGIPADEIIARIDKSATPFELTEDDVAYLHKKGVSQRVIEAMQEKI